jgi:hypothetical protein
VLGSNGDAAHTHNAFRGSHWDCWLPVSQEFVHPPARNVAKLGKHMGTSLWKTHLSWASNSSILPIAELDLANAIIVGE